MRRDPVSGHALTQMNCRQCLGARGYRRAELQGVQEGDPGQHTIEAAVPTAETDSVVRELEQLDDVISLSVYRGVSIKPHGDVISVHTLNRGADDIPRVVSLI
jgi:hypothetical protein